MNKKILIIVIFIILAGLIIFTMIIKNKTTNNFTKEEQKAISIAKGEISNRHYDRIYNLKSVSKNKLYNNDNYYYLHFTPNKEIMDADIVMTVDISNGKVIDYQDSWS